MMSASEPSAKVLVNGRVPRSAVDRLPFQLPDFTRYSWVSDGARRIWEGRVERIRNAWAELEWRSVLQQVRSCALVGLAPNELARAIPQWSANELSALALPISPESHPGVVFAVVGQIEAVTRARDAWLAREDDVVGSLLGYPKCCRKFFNEVWVNQRSTDTTWAMATNTMDPTGGVVVVEPQQAPLANILWRWLGVRAVPHLPCRFDCEETLHFGERLLAVAERSGYAEEAQWIRELLAWPVEWSALHGIAEITTPILKLSTRTDATASKYVVRWTGSQYPQEGATGLRFPYRALKRRQAADARTVQLGLKRPDIATPLRDDWYHLDNGFSSSTVMSELHAPLVAIARRELGRTAGSVLDLGCGNGALLAKICAGRDDLIPHGVDANPVALGRVSELLPQFADNFRVADLFACDSGGRGSRYALTLLMAGRLLEVERRVAERLLQWLRESSDAVLVYVYPGVGTRSLASIVEEFGLRLQESAADNAGLLSDQARFETDGVDWSRLAEPQADEYDSDVILRLATTTVSGNRPQPYQRTPVAESPALFDGRVAIRPLYRALPEFEAFSAHYLDAPADHPNLRLAAEYVRCWPQAFAQCQRLLEAIHPAIDARIPLESTELYRGSSCHSYEQMFGTLWATIFCPIGLAEAIVHELAHQKLRVLGVSFESATAIVGNDPSCLYVSPIVKDRERPMTAVLHAQYSYVHVTVLDIHLFEAEQDPTRRSVLGVVLDRNLSRIEEGRDTLRAHFEAGEHGRAFMTGFSGWTDRTIERGRELLARARESGSRQVPSALMDAARSTSVEGAPERSRPEIDTRANVIEAHDRRVEVIASFAPRIVLLGNALSDEECDALVEYCTSRLTLSQVIADTHGNVRLHANRTSRDAMLRRAETPLVERIEARLAALAQWPQERGEGLGVVCYEPGEQYRAHCDWIDPDLEGLREHLEAGGQRLATFVLYLSDVEAGGETLFPELGVKINPRKGSALFFANTDAQHVPDRATLHAGCPVSKGVKFIANKWLRQRAC